MQQKLHHRQRVNSCRNIVQHDPRTFWKALQLPHRWRLDNVENTKKYKTQEESFPSERDGDQCDQLACNFVDYHKLWIFHARCACHLRSGGNPNQRDQQCQRDRYRSSQKRRRRQGISSPRPKPNRRRRSPSPRPRPQSTNTKKSRNQSRPQRTARARHVVECQDSSSGASGSTSRIISSASVTGDEIT